MASNHKNSMRVLEQTEVSPAPGSVVHSSSLPLTFFDILWLYAAPVERLFFYHFPHSTAHFIESYLPNLKSSLSLTLQHFYPLAGKVRLSPNSTDQFELHYAEGDSISFTVAECDFDFVDLVGSHARDFAMFRCLVPLLPEAVDDSRPLVAIQVSLFPNQGISIGFTVHHVACDGVNSMHFIKSWASSCISSGQVPLAGASPSFNRSAIVDPCNLYSEYFSAMLEFKTSNTVRAVPPSDPPSDLVTATFNLGPNHVEGLKDLVHSNAKTTFNCSTFVACCAYVWLCVVKSRGYTAERKTCFVFVVDWRTRLQPLPPATYFGNCIGGCLAVANVSDLIKEDGIVVAAETIASAIEGVKEGVVKNMKGAMNRFVAVIPYDPLSVAGSPKFKVYDTDFGWGRPAKVEVPSIQKYGAMSLAESREGQGGVEIGFALPQRQMEALIVHFGDNLKTLFN